MRQQPVGGLPLIGVSTTASPADLCHILFTSGLTEVPKGVMLEHRAVARNARILADCFGLGGQTRTLQFATYAQLTLTVISFLDPARILTLKVLVSSGKQLIKDKTIVGTIQEISVACTLPPSSLIYKPGSQEEALVGTVREICVTGRFYRTGDLGFLYSRPDSAESTICLVGRIDSQVKLHGVRVDLGDVETALASYKGTRESVASVPKTGPMRGKLAAVVSITDPGPWLLGETPVAGLHLVHPSEPSQKPVLTRLTNCVICSYLPLQAVPGTWWVIDELPLTTSGRLDRIRICTWLESILEVEIMVYARAWATTDIHQEQPVSNGGTV
ncbi:hypothetical protein F5X98DRAFT_385301 [Xylaria grammica]|nr:hypothetical protein F5X98DRAFT_385301 [Xylaria grammica]